MNFSSHVVRHLSHSGVIKLADLFIRVIIYAEYVCTFRLDLITYIFSRKSILTYFRNDDALKVQRNNASWLFE